MGTTINKKITFFFGHKTRGIITNSIIALFTLLFIYTATSKIFTFKDFGNVLYLVPLVGPYHFTVAILIISLEIIIGVLLIIPFTQKIGLYATLALLFIFTIYLSYMISFVEILPCSCGGITSYLSWKEHIWFNLLLIFLAGTGILTNQ